MSKRPEITHRLPERASQKLDIHHPPEQDPQGYLTLVGLLDQLGQALDQAEVEQAFLRRWEATVMAELSSKEADRFMMHPETGDEFIIDNLAEVRWRNLKAILLARKGVPARYLSE